MMTKQWAIICVANRTALKHSLIQLLLFVFFSLPSVIDTKDQPVFYLKGNLDNL